MNQVSEDFQKDINAIQAVNVIPTILDVICRTTGMGYATVARVTQERWVACAVLDNINFGLAPGGELKVETTLCHEVRQFHKPIVVDDFDEDELFRGHHTPAMYGLRSYIAVPIWLKNGDFFGTLCAIHPDPSHVKNPETIGMFNLYADLIAMHLQNNAELESAQASLFHEKKIAKLREQFIAVLGHDLRNPLGAMKNVAQLLKSGKLDEAAVQRFAGTLMNSYGRMAGLIDNLMDFARGRLGSGINIHPEWQEIEQPLRHVIDELQLIWPGRAIQINVELSGPVYGDIKRITQLFSNLLSNALSHGDAKSPVKVLFYNNNQEFKLSVANTGKPIPAEILTLIFEPFSRAASAEGEEGLGLGLFIASEIAKAHGGQITVLSNLNETSFTLTIPQK